MSSEFQERFKNRVNYVGKQGVIDINDSTGIQKPLNSQVFDIPNQSPKSIVPVTSKISKFITSSYEIPISPGPEEIKQPESQIRKQTHSAKPYRNIDIETRNDLRTQQGHKPYDDYKPYTLKDYQNIKTDKYYELGGLGPSNIGTEEWKQRKEMIEKRLSYAKQVKMANANLPPSNMRKPQREPEKEISKAEKAKQFARMIPKPLAKEKKIICESTPAVSSVLEELEKQHLAYKASVDAIRTEYR